MNFYIRYFDSEALVYSVEDVLDFLSSIPEIDVTPQLEADVREYLESDVTYPKRYKVRQRIYFIIIKTTAANMRDFKDKKAVRGADMKQAKQAAARTAKELLEEQRFGWYEGTINFKRVQIDPSNGKCFYLDTTFSACCKAMSGADCYDRIMDHLLSRVDNRSQFPSMKGKNFCFRYLGREKTPA